MTRGVAAAAGILCAFLAGCAIRPDVKDVTGVDTYEVVRRIRCEMRDSIRAFAIGTIRRHDRNYPHYAAQLATDAGFRTFDLARLDPDARALVERYDDTVIGYAFEFDISEDNTLSASLGLGRILQRGPFGIALSGQHNRTRQNKETFRIIDSFVRLSRGVSDDYCGPAARPGGAHVYPITGRLGLGDIVKKFLDFNQSGNLAGPAGGTAAPAYNTEITFTTLVSGKINPTVQLAAIADTLKITGAGAASEVIRQDIHKVTIAFSLPDKDLRKPTIAEERVTRELDKLQLLDDDSRLRNRLDQLLR